MYKGSIPRFAFLALDQAGNELFNLRFFANEWVEDSVNAVELEYVRRLVGKSGGEVIHGMFEHVDAVNTEVLCFWTENLSWRRCDGAR